MRPVHESVTDTSNTRPEPGDPRDGVAPNGHTLPEPGTATGAAQISVKSYSWKSATSGTQRCATNAAWVGWSLYA